MLTKFDNHAKIYADSHYRIESDISDNEGAIS